MPDRQSILNRLKAAPSRTVTQRPQMPPLREPSMDAAQLIETFVARVAAQGGVTECISKSALFESMAALLAHEGVTRLMLTPDSLLETRQWIAWGQTNGIEVMTPSDFTDRTEYTQAVFDRVQAGLTGVDFAVAESGTLVLAHDASQARLVSLAPLLHIAVVPATRIVPVYESAIEILYTRTRRPSQVTFITGPSMTADIQATPFKGMHGPRKLVVFLLDACAGHQPS
jgi:L-lactate dehydrogenase complex protein LldG